MMTTYDSMECRNLYLQTQASFFFLRHFLSAVLAQMSEYVGKKEKKSKFIDLESLSSLI